MVLKKKVNPIPSSLREKKRYVYFEFLSSEKLGKTDVFRAIWDSLLVLFGAIGSSSVGFMLIEFDSASNRGICRCIRGKEDDLKSAIVLIESVSNIKIIPQILRVSGTLRSIRKS